MAAEAAAIEESDPQIRVSFVTKHASLRVPETAFAVPESLDSHGLSEVVSHLLDRAGAFEFVAHDEVLRGSLSDFLLRRSDVSREEVLRLEYFPRVPAPSDGGNRSGPDWCGAIGGDGSLVVSGWYDGSVLVHDLKDGKLTEKPSVGLRGHSGAIKSLSVGEEVASWKVLTGSKDMSVKMWRLSGEGLTCTWVGSCAGSVTGVALGPGLHVSATGDYSGGLALWASEVQPTGGSELGRSKRRRGSGGDVVHGAAYAEPVEVVASAHDGHVAALTWTAEDEIVTGGGDDRGIKWWSIGAKADLVVEKHGPKAVTDLSVAPSRTTVATAHPDHLVRLWDARSSALKPDAAVGPQATLRGGHTAWVNKVQWHPTEEHFLATASHDHTVRLWDTRVTSAPLHTLTEHEGKAIALAWTNEQTIVSGGQDCILRAATISL